MTAETGGGYRVALPEFEGPLDLLLHLCKTHEIDIVHIPISFITEKYLEYLDLMQSMPFDVAADYLVMAATLAYLKSRELVPTPEPLEVVGDEEGEVLDPREELIRRLLEYQKYKDAAEKLGGRPIEGRTVFGRGMELANDSPDAPFAEQSVWKLIEAFGRILEKAGGAKAMHEVTIERVSISARMNQLIDRIAAGSGSFQLEACFDFSLPEPELRSLVVVTLMAILEMARLKVVRVLQSPDGETLFITQAAGVSIDDARQAAATTSAEIQGEGQGQGEGPGQGQGEEAPVEEKNEQKNEQT
jgi:segregation and condensation protein A